MLPLRDVLLSLMEIATFAQVVKNIKERYVSGLQICAFFNVLSFSSVLRLKLMTARLVVLHVATAT